MTSAQYNKLKKQKKIIRLLANKKTSLKTKHKALTKQSGGFLLPLLSTILPVILGGLINR